MAELHAAAEPGMSEVAAWAELQKGNYIRGGEWIETRIFSSGPRTNPWFQECGPRILQEGDILAYDTDMIGPYGYCADISRTWVCGAEPTPEQRALYHRALDEIEHNSVKLENILVTRLQGEQGR